jgi:hypothetical protein
LASDFEEKILSLQQISNHYQTRLLWNTLNVLLLARAQRATPQPFTLVVPM